MIKNQLSGKKVGQEYVVEGLLLHDVGFSIIMTFLTSLLFQAQTFVSHL